jgi:hypothetical protein
MFVEADRILGVPLKDCIPDIFGIQSGVAFLGFNIFNTFPAVGFVAYFVTHDAPVNR